MTEHRPYGRVFKGMTVIAVAAASAFTIRAAIAARRACWGDLMPLPRGTTPPPPESFQMLTQQGEERRPGFLHPNERVASLGDVEIYYFDLAFGSSPGMGNHSLYVMAPSSCSGTILPYGRSRNDSPYLLWYSPDYDIYRINSIWNNIESKGASSKDALDFRRVARPGHVFVSPRLRLINSLTLVLGMVSLGVGWRRGPRWLLAALLLAGTAALLSRCG